MIRLATLTAAAIALAVVGTYAWRSRERMSGQSSGTLSIAVLPFDNLGDTSDAYFADGMTDAVRGKLTTVPGLIVIAPASSSHYRKTTKSPQQIGRELGVRYLLIGRVRWSKVAGSPSRVQLDPALIDVVTASDKWEAPFDAPLTDVFQVQADIASRVVQQLRVTLTPADQQALERRPTRDLDAYNAYLRGHAVEAEGNNSVVEHRAAMAYGEAIRRDSSFALAWAALANAHLWAIGSAIPTQAADDAEAARVAAQRALSLAPELPEAHAAQGLYYDVVLVDPVRALAEYQQGRRLAPDNVTLLTLTSEAEWARGLYDSSLTHREEAARLDPRDADALSAVCEGYAAFRRYADAQGACDHALALYPTNLGLVESRIFVSLEQGDLAGARAVVRAALGTVDSAQLVQYLAEVNELGWVLDSAQERVLLRGPKSAAVSGDPDVWSLALAQQYGYRGDTARARIFADSARIALAAQLAAVARHQKTFPANTLAQLHVFYGLALGYLGRQDSAVAEAVQAHAAEPSESYIDFTAAKVYLLANQPDRALELIEYGVEHPPSQSSTGVITPMFTPGYLRIDANFARLRSDPRFQRLVAGDLGAPR